MTDKQKQIIALILQSFQQDSTEITEEKITQAVDMQDQYQHIINGTPLLTQTEKEEIITILHSKLFIKINRGHFIQEKDHHPWYMASKRKNEESFWIRYWSYLAQKHWSPDTISELDRTTDDIMDLLGNPDLETPFLRRGLCIGDVQSGKTSTYIGLINKAADAHYRIIILLTGTIEKLRRQTQKRIDEGFTGLSSLDYNRSKKQVQVGVGSIDPSISAWAVTSVTSDFNAASASKFSGRLATIGAPIIFVVKKNKNILNKLEAWIRKFNTRTASPKVNLPMLLIDDEADNASVNTKQDDVTAINKAIRKLLNLFEKSNYVGFTATPYANIFIDPDSDEEMLSQDLFPKDFIYALESPSNYIGARSIFGENARCSYMLESNDDCEAALPIQHKKDAVLKEIPLTLKEAICAFFIANTIRDLRGEEPTHRTMMVNISRFINVQNHIEKILDQYIRSMKTEIHNYYKMGEEALNYESFALLHSVYDKYFKSFRNNPHFADLRHFDWPEIQEALYPAIASIEVRAINGGNASKKLNYEDYEETGLRLIAVGGLSLSRGLTLEGLCTSYFYRNSSMYDTLMQMGRWFGYRESYRDLCKIWMPKNSMSWYAYISNATDELRDEVRQMQNENMTPKDFGLAVRSDIQGLLVTARNKMRSASDYETMINFSGTMVETHHIHSSKDILERNYENTEDFLSSLQNNYPIHQNDQNLALKNPQFLNVKKEEILKYLQGFSVHTLNAATGFSIPELTRMFKDDQNNIFDNWDILIAEGRSSTPQIQLAGLDIHPVSRNFTYNANTKSLQMSGRRSRLGSRTMAKGGLSLSQVHDMESRNPSPDKAYSEVFYFRSGLKRNPLLVIYPVILTPHENQDEKNIAESLKFPVIGLSIGIPLIHGVPAKKIKYKINKQKALEIFGIDDIDDFEETDETIREE